VKTVKTVGDAIKRHMKAGLTEHAAFRTFTQGIDQEIRGEIATEIGNGFLARFNDQGKRHIEGAISELFEMRKPLRFRRYLLVLLAQVDEHAHNRGVAKHKKINSVSKAIDRIQRPSEKVR
jgi:hypothetical protein